MKHTNRDGDFDLDRIRAITEEVVRQHREDQDGECYTSVQVSFAKQEARLAALEEAAKVAEEHAIGKKRLCSDGNRGHDDRYCAECEAMCDEADVLAQEIRALKTHVDSKLSTVNHERP